MPVDAAPTADGNVVLTWSPKLQQLQAASVTTLTAAPLGDRKRYVSHFVTCPDRQAWRKKA